MGLSTEVREKVKVQWKDPNYPAGGFEYLYLEDEDYQRFKAGKDILRAEVGGLEGHGGGRGYISVLLGTA